MVLHVTNPIDNLLHSMLRSTTLECRLLKYSVYHGQIDASMLIEGVSQIDRLSILTDPMNRDTRRKGGLAVQTKDWIKAKYRLIRDGSRHSTK
jgi:hypothetical protein